MSYILDSIKKSDKERQVHEQSAAMVMRNPPFLDNDKPARTYTGFIVLLCLMVLLVAAYFVYTYSQSKPASNSQRLVENNQAAVEAKSKTTISTGTNQNKLSKKPVDAAALKAKQEAVLLYKQALANKARPEVDSLYDDLQKPTAVAGSTEAVGSENTVGAVATGNETGAARLGQAENQEIAIENPAVDSSESQQVAEQSSAVFIPSIYELDAYFRKTIPSVSYGAHIYATDNNSGFVILDGARRRVGDKLDSGLFVEQIREEQVVLSYNGRVFSLPAMKSWESK